MTINNNPTPRKNFNTVSTVFTPTVVSGTDIGHELSRVRRCSTMVSGTDLGHGLSSARRCTTAVSGTDIGHELSNEQ